MQSHSLKNSHAIIGDDQQKTKTCSDFIPPQMWRLDRLVVVIVVIQSEQ